MVKKEFIILVDIHKGLSDKLLRKNVPVKVLFNLHDIISIGEAFNHKGLMYKDRCNINIRDIGTMLVKGSYDKIISSVYPIRVIGYGR